jgi:hypothetical protein
MRDERGKTPRWIVYSVDGSVLDGPFDHLRAARRSAKHAGDVAVLVRNERNGRVGWRRHGKGGAVGVVGAVQSSDADVAAISVLT